MPGSSHQEKQAPAGITPDHSSATPRSWFERFVDRTFAPISIAPLVYFRIAFGAILVWSISMFFDYKGVDLIARYFIEPPIHFNYYGFGWVEPLPGRGMYVLFFLLGVAAAMVAAGLLYRFAAAAFCLGFTYVFLCEQTRYMNHYYLVCLVSFLLVFIPANRAFALDSLLMPSIRSATVPAWTLWILRAQFGIVYFYAGLAKCHWDWLGGTVMRMKLERKTDFPFLGSLFKYEWVPVAFSWGGLLLDLFVFPMLLWKRTRVPALIAALTFHLMNARLFNIDIFPWMMIASTVILFFPDWLPWFGRKKTRRAWATTPDPNLSRPYSTGTKATLTCVALYLLIQILIPLRHAAYQGDADWTEEGQQFAWRMLMREKHVVPPRFDYSIRKEGRVLEGQVPIPFPGNFNFWNSHWQFQKMALNPDILLQFCHKFADRLRAQGATDVEIHAHVLVSLNGREPRPLVDPSVNLAAEPRRWLSPYPWVLPLDAPLPDSPRADGKR